LHTYAEFQSYLTDFVEGRYPFLWVAGRPGLSKTEEIKKALRGRSALYFKGGQLTPPRFYIECFRARGRPVIMDDAEHLLEDRVGARLIAALGDSGAAKLLTYATTGRVLGDVPQSYYTTSSLCIIANRPTKREDIRSRAVTLYFDPTNVEVHRAVARWYWDQAIHDWFGRHLQRLPPLDIRWYVVADRDKRAGRNWQKILLETHPLHRRDCIVQDVENDRAYPTREDKARRFKELMGTARGASRASYFRFRKRLEGEGGLVVEPAPLIPLRRTRPPGVPPLAELDSMATPPPARPEEDRRPPDAPGREAFSEPIRGGGAAPPAPPPRIRLDDSLPWEQPRGRDDDDEEEA